jgi:uncharacterized repeat protein (TIGR03803 family)
MTRRYIPTTPILICVLLFGMLAATPAFADPYKVIRWFDTAIGATPEAGLIFDSSGNLYGTTWEGGPHNTGTVFELTPDAAGKWIETVLYNFCPVSGCADGAHPAGGLVFDSAGNLYGTATQGGSNGQGVAFELSPGANGSWTQQVLYNFCSAIDCADGSNPNSALVMDDSGNLYGTALQSVENGTSIAFQLAPRSGGGWTEIVLPAGNGTVLQPSGSLTLDSSGNLYGVANGGNNYQNCKSHCGFVYQLVPAEDGYWTQKILYWFDSAYGSNPVAGVILDASGNLYGVTQYGGSFNNGVVFELTPAAHGAWTPAVIHSFGAVPHNAFGPLAFDAFGNLYGTTYDAGAYGQGTVYKLTPGQNGKWTDTVLHSFTAQSGAYPLAGVTLDSSGNIYGTTYAGGPDNWGTVFEITP